MLPTGDFLLDTLSTAFIQEVRTEGGMSEQQPIMAPAAVMVPEPNVPGGGLQ